MWVSEENGSTTWQQHDTNTTTLQQQQTIRGFVEHFLDIAIILLLLYLQLPHLIVLQQ
ncbi:MAG: hypothetical protein ACI90V_002861 [Bacillariaceae sp.]